MSLSEQFRPSRWEAVAGQEKAIARIHKIAGRGGYGGKCWFFSGVSSSGKTTCARIIAREVAPDLCIDEVNAQDVNLAYVEEMERGMRQRPLPVAGKSGMAWILNEAHLFRGAILSRLLTTLEPIDGIPPWCVVILTTTKEGKKDLFDDYHDAGPFASRCKNVAFTNQGLSEVFAIDCVRKCREAGMLNGHTDQFYIDKVLGYFRKNKTNYRELWSEVEAGLFDDH